MSRGIACLAGALAFLFGLAVTAVSATACEGGGGGGAELTSLATKLSGEGKEAETITILEGAKAKDKATLSGKNASKATGKLTYKIYSEKECKTLVINAGEVTVSGESVPASSEEQLEGGKAYYWQARYTGDSKNAESTSACTEILNVKAKVALSTKLSGESLEGEAITVTEEAELTDRATLSGVNSSTGTGKVLYTAYSDSKCEHLVAELGEVTLESGGKVPASSEAELVGGASYYWLAVYKGDALHQEATSPCGKEVSSIKASTTLATSLSGEGKAEVELTVAEGAAVSDTATLTGTKASTATGTVTYKVYADAECTELVASAGEVTVSGEHAPASTQQTLPPGTYFWQASYSGDSQNQASTSECGTEIEFVTPHVTTSLTSEGQSGEELELLEGAGVRDVATLHGEHAGEATGTVTYGVYSDSECKQLVATAGEVTVKGATAPASNEEKLKAGTYYWQASYSGDANNPAAKSTCGMEVVLVQPPTSLATSLAGEGHSGERVEVQEGAAVADTAKLSGTNAAKANGYIEYNVYSDSGCKELAAQAGDVSVTNGSVPTSTEETLPVGTYYWQAIYTGDGSNHGSTSTCGAEVSVVTAPLTTALSGEERSGSEIEVEESAGVSDVATIHGEHASEATGTVTYSVYSDSECKQLAAKAGEVTVKGATAPASSEEKLKGGTYYWQASYSGDAKNPASKSTCGTEIAFVQPANWKYAAIGDSFSSGEGASRYYQMTNRSLKPPRRNRFNECRRSLVGYPARLAEAFFQGLGTTAENQVLLQQPPRFIFRACSGAVIRNLWGAGAGAGQWKEWIEPNGWLVAKPAQDLWLELPGGVPNLVILPNNAITEVTLTIGGNDAGFGTIGRNCIRGLPGYSRARCLGVIAEWQAGQPGAYNTIQIPSPTMEEGLPTIATLLPTVLLDIHESAPDARILVLMYPRIVNIDHNGDIPAGPVNARAGSAAFGLRIENSVPRGIMSVAVMLDQYEAMINTAVSTTVQAWVRGARGRNATVIDGTINAFLPNQFNDPEGHRLGDRQPWVNTITLPTRASIHPNCLGHRRIATVVLASLRRPVPGGWRACP